VKVRLLDLGIGNLHSLAKAFAAALPEASVDASTDVQEALAADLVVLPGVGGWGAIDLAERRAPLRDALEAGKPCIGVCLGMQLLFESSEEAAGEGLGFFAGPVTRLAARRTPHMGWSHLERGQLDVPLPEAVYYAHSFACRPTEEGVVLATSTVEEDRFAAMVRKKQTIGCQFHPEKSSRPGVELLGALARMVTS
jgi:glutamine amidotransferase